MIKLSDRAMALKPSATLAMAAKAAELRSKGVDVISFATGEPDFDTPINVKNECKKSLDAGDTKYPPSAGLAPLRKAICKKLKDDNKLDYSENDIVVTCGAKLAIYNALQVLVNAGNEVIIPAPYWVSYPDQVMLADGKPVFIPTTAATNFKITPEYLKKAITSKTRAIILNTPSNPTGSAYTANELAALAKILVEHNVAIISDEIYEKLVYGDFKHVSIADAHPPAKDITIVINGVSKAYAMTGWRMGYAAGPKDIISKMKSLIEQQISGIPGFVQKACIEALSGPQEELAKMRDEFCARRDMMFKLLGAIPNIKCHLPEGAFYLLPNVEHYFGKKWSGGEIKNATDVANYLLEKAHIGTVSGDPFGAPGHIRFSYATSRKNIEEGMLRMKNALLALSV